MKSEEKSEQSNYLVIAFFAFLGVIFVQKFFPGVIPFNTFEFWEMKGPLLDAIKTSWFLFLWVIVVTVITIFRKIETIEESPKKILAGGFISSAFAGITEEISFRWLIFLHCIWVIQLTNYIFFGFAGFGISEWIYTIILIPIASFLSLGALDAILYSPIGWFIGAAVLLSNAMFRDGHKYLGLLGYVNSWFVGLYLFYLMFEFGLISSIVIHFLYDMVIFVIIFIGICVNNRR